MHSLIQLFIKFDHTIWDRHEAYRSNRTSDPVGPNLGQGKKSFRNSGLNIKIHQTIGHIIYLSPVKMVLNGKIRILYGKGISTIILINYSKQQI
jgi:hypothetical protein